MNKMNVPGNWSYQETLHIQLANNFFENSNLHYFYEAILTHLYYTQNI